MIANFHTHTNYCDGKNTAEEIVKAALERGFTSIGFSGHGYTDFDLRYCMKDTAGYIAEINTLKEKYKEKIQIYLGVEEDAFCETNRGDFDYIIGSSHYFHIGENYHPIDSNYDYFKKCLDLFGGDISALTESYYEAFCEYILRRKPDIVGHFDLITKFDELDDSLFLKNEKYLKMSEKYLSAAMKSGCIFEVNTGAMARGYRTSPYPYDNLLWILKKNEGKLILSSDSHNAENLDYGFENTRKILKTIGFEHVYMLKDGSFQKDKL